MFSFLVNIIFLCQTIQDNATDIPWPCDFLFFLADDHCGALLLILIKSPPFPLPNKKGGLHAVGRPAQEDTGEQQGSRTQPASRIARIKKAPCKIWCCCTSWNTGFQTGPWFFCRDDNQLSKFTPCFQAFFGGGDYSWFPFIQTFDWIQSFVLSIKYLQAEGLKTMDRRVGLYRNMLN